MSTRAPSFLLGGINLTKNFLGKRTATTAAYGLFETGVKMSPFFLVFVMSGKKMAGDESTTTQAPCSE